MGVRGAYWQGVRLWEAFQRIDASAQASTSVLHQGVDRQYAARNADSHNFTRPIRVETVVPADKTDSGDLPDWLVVRIQLLDVERDLISIADSTPQGPLSICQDVDRKADVSGGPYSGNAQTISHGTAGGSWTPTAGRKVLVRKPSSGEGFVATIDSVGSGTVTLDVPSGYTVTSDWDLVDVQLVFPDCAYRTMSGGDPSEWEEVGIPKVAYDFDCESDPAWATAHDQSHDNT